MFKVTDEHIDFILADLKSKGIVLKDLQENIVDHVCCLIETELIENGDFETHYEKIIPQFFNQELKELFLNDRHITNLLLNDHESVFGLDNVHLF